MAITIHRGPVRLTATVPRHLHEALISRADIEGRSLSNLVAYLLEWAIQSCSDPSRPGQVALRPKSS